MLKDKQKLASLYSIWQSMQRRCDGLNCKEKDAERYHNRGITYCTRWESWKNFVEDMYPTYEKGLYLDRIDNDGNYEPSNCRWVTPKESNRNKSNTIYIEYEGKQQPLSKICENLNLPYHRIVERYLNNKTRDVTELLSKEKLPNRKKGQIPITPCIICGTYGGAIIKNYERPIRKRGMCNACYNKTRSKLNGT